MKGIIGTIAGDIIGSVYEFNPIKSKKFELFHENSEFTDDTIMTLAVADWLMEDKNSKEVLIRKIKEYGNTYPDPYGGYGGMFRKWLQTENPKPYESWGNGSAMRVSPVPWASSSLEENRKLSKMSAEVTHNHPEGIKGALATSDAIYLARTGKSKEEIRKHIENQYNYDLSRTVDEIRPEYEFEVSCQKSVPESIICFLDGKNYEDTVRNTISLGGDADTMGAIAGSIASAYYEVPRKIQYKAINKLDNNLLNTLIQFEDKFL